MSLREQIAADRDAVFFKTDEFAELAVVDGKEVKIIIDTDALNGKSDVYAKGLSEGEILIFIMQEEMSREPNINDQMSIKGKRWYVRHCLPEFGVYEIRLGRTKGNAG